MIDWQARAMELQIENETLRAKLAEQAVPSLIRQSVFGLTRSEAIIFSVLMHHKAPHRDTFLNALYGDRNDPPDGKTLDILICKMRRKLGTYDIRINTIHGQGFEMPDASKSRARELMGA
jgi:DNA-binding response OmpR family regulator